MKIKFLLFFLLAGFSVKTFAQTGFPFDNEIRAFKHQDSLSFPKPDGILFIGSSSIRKWDDLEKRFADKPIIKRGVGGCELSQLVKYYTPYILFPYHPAKIFIYAGENDLNSGETPDSVFANVKTLWTMIATNLPDAKIYFLSIKSAPSRIGIEQKELKANEMIKNYLADKPNTTFIDVSSVIYKPGTIEPDPTLFQDDMLHLKPIGYDRWQKVLEPYVN
jgi:GDSL-like Lipase/Acylhydrolase family